jgi:hypothetical protein
MFRAYTDEHPSSEHFIVKPPGDAIQAETRRSWYEMLLMTVLIIRRN